MQKGLILIAAMFGMLFSTAVYQSRIGNVGSTQAS